MVTQIAGRGTAEETWLPWLDQVRSGGPELSELDLSAAGSPIVVAPHPDDEVLGLGGLLCRLGRGEVIAVTDGEASHPRSQVYGPAALAHVRRRETTEALARLGLPHAAVHHLGHPDGGIDEDRLTAELERRLSPGRWCLATWREDGHPDHEAVGRAASRACESTGARLLEYPVWMWHWARPGDPRVPWHRMRAVNLNADHLASKAAAIAAFRSQIQPIGPDPADAAILPPHIVARFTRPYEVVLT